MTFKESQQQAINEAVDLNKSEGFYRWKSVSMSSTGFWFADECEVFEMEIDYSIGCFMSRSGLDVKLNTRFTDTPICDWDKSLASVPH